MSEEVVAAKALARLEELDRIPGWIVDEDLLAAGSGDNLVAERQPRGTEPFYLGGNVVDEQVDAVPPARFRLTSVRHRPGGGALRPAEEQAQIPSQNIGEGRRLVRLQREAEMTRVEGDRSVDVVDDVTDIDGLIVHESRTVKTAQAQECDCERPIGSGGDELLPCC